MILLQSCYTVVRVGLLVHSVFNAYNFFFFSISVPGNEGSGLAENVESRCHQLVTIPPGRSTHHLVDCLNVSVATGRYTLMGNIVHINVIEHDYIAPFSINS